MNAKLIVAAAIVLTLLMLFIHQSDGVNQVDAPHDRQVRLGGGEPLSTEEIDISQDELPATLMSRFGRNEELAKEHYYVDQDGNVVLPTNEEMEFKKNFSFSNGETIELPYSIERKFGRQLSSELDDGLSPAFFDNLRNAALGGDSQAGVAAYREVVRCYSLHSSSEERVEGGRCSEVDAGMYDEAVVLLEIQADRGSAVAREILASNVARTEPERARQLYQALWADGFVSGLGGLRQLPRPSADSKYEQLIEHEAAAHASYAVTIAYLDGIPDSAIAQHAEAIAMNESQHLLSFSHTVQMAIEARASEILTSNDACCRIFIED